jgi:hypothetical protein
MGDGKWNGRWFHFPSPISHLPFAAFFLTVAIAWTWPVATRLTTRIPHDPGDPILNAWILWWNTQAAPFADRWWSPPIFFPAGGTFTLSEHLFGIALFTAPLQFAGLNPIGAYNIALILSYWLSGFFAYLLGRKLTGSVPAALVAGVAFACAPYRAGQLSHLQVLTAQWMPLMLLAMHAYADDRRRRWLALFAVAWLLQALSNGYYLLFFPVLFALWLAWFVRWTTHARTGIALLTTFAVASLALVPSLLRYREVHGRMGLTRTRGEMVLFSAHPDSLLRMPSMLRLWPDGTGRTQEDFLFPGITALLIVTTAVAAAVRVTSIRRALRERSALMFYALATPAMWWLAMGPAAGDAPLQALARPYTWLTVLPGFSGLRAPSRFAMLACLTLSVAAALGVRRLAQAHARWATVIGAVAVTGLLLDGWTVPIPLAVPAGRFVVPEVKDAVVVELPLDSSLVNTSAMYRATFHRLPLINGYSGHTPPHFRILESALRRDDPTALEFFARGRALVIIVNGRADANGDVLRFVRTLRGIEEQGSSAAGSVFVLPPRPRERIAGFGEQLAIAGITPEPREHAVIDLGRVHIVRGISFPLRWHFDETGTHFGVEASGDGHTWSTVWLDWIGALALTGALENQKEVPVRITLPDVTARYLRIHPAPKWMTRELSVHAPNR